MHDVHVPIDELRPQVELMTAIGVASTDVAAILGIDIATLRASYADELQFGKAKMIAAVGMSLFEQAIGRPAIYDENGNLVQSELKPDKTCAIFIMKTQGGWTENHAVQVADPTVGACERLAAAVDSILANAAPTPESDPLN